jgi:hypothetical protein
VRLALAWAALALAPIVLGGLRPWLAADAARPALEWCASAVLYLSVTALPLMWAARAGSEGPNAWRRRAQEAALLLAAAAPGWALAWPFSDREPAQAWAGLAVAGLTCLASGALVSWGAPRTGAGRVALVSVWVGAWQLVVWAGADLARLPEAWRWVAPPLVLGRALDGTAGVEDLLALSVVGAAIAAGLWTLRRGPGLAVSACLLGCCALGGAVTAQEVRVRPLLGDRLRPGEPYPVLVEGLSGDESALAARSLEHRFASQVSGSRAWLAPTPLGGGHRLQLLREASGGGQGDAWEELGVQLPDPVEVRPRDVLVGTIGRGARPLAASLLQRATRVEVVDVDPDLLPLLAQAGEALDALVVGAGVVGAAPANVAYLRAWAAAGGALVVRDSSDLIPILQVESASGPVVVRPLGSGVVIGGEGLDDLGVREAAGLARTLGLRGQRRERRGALGEAALRYPLPGPGPAQGRRVALAALAVLGVLGILCRLRTRVGAGTFVGGGALTCAALAVCVQAVATPPQGPYVRSLTVLDLPSGSSVAGRLELLSFSAARRGDADVLLADARGGPPRPLFDSRLAAAADRGEVRLGPAGARLLFPAGPHLRAFLRQDASAWEGSVTLAEEQAALLVRNDSPYALHTLTVLVRGAAYPLDDLPSGSEVRVDLGQPGVEFDRWRLNPPQGAAPSDWRLLVAALAGRDLFGGVHLVGWASPGALADRVLSGVAGVEQEAPLIVVRVGD